MRLIVRALTPNRMASPLEAAPFRYRLHKSLSSSCVCPSPRCGLLAGASGPLATRGVAMAVWANCTLCRHVGLDSCSARATPRTQTWGQTSTTLMVVPTPAEGSDLPGCARTARRQAEALGVSPWARSVRLGGRLGRGDGPGSVRVVTVIWTAYSPSSRATSHDPGP